MNVELRHVYFTDKINEYNIYPLKFLDLNLFNSFQTHDTAKNTLIFLKKLFHFKMIINSPILDYSENIDEEHLNQMVSLRIKGFREEKKRFPITMIMVTEKSLNSCSLATMSLFQRLIRVHGKNCSCYIIIVNHSKTFIEANGVLFSFAPIKSLINLQIDPISIVLSTNNSIKKDFLYPRPVSRMPILQLTLAGKVFLPLMLTVWPLFNKIRIHFTDIRIGSFIAPKKDLTKIFGVVYQDNSYYYLSDITQNNLEVDQSGFTGFIVGKIDKKDINNFSKMNWIES